MASFGLRLKQEREQRGITLDEISSTTKIGTRMLVALETDHFDQLPGGIFNKGFIRAYARCLGLDEEQTIADYLVASGNAPSEKEKDKRSDPESSFDFQAEADESNLPWGTFAILLLLIALGFAGWGFYSRTVRKPARMVVPPSSSTSRGIPPTPVPAAQTPVSPVIAAKKPSLPGQSSPKSLSLRIVLRSDSWLSVTSDGQEIMQGSFTAPTERTIHAAKEIVVKAGNVGGIDFEFDGRPMPLEGAPGEVKTLIFDAAGLRPSAPSPTPSAQQP